MLYIRTHAYSSTFSDSDVTLQVIIAVVVKIYVFWNVTPCTFIELYFTEDDGASTFGEDLISFTLTMGAGGSSERLVNFYQTARHQIAEE